MLFLLSPRFLLPLIFPLVFQFILLFLLGSSLDLLWIFCHPSSPFTPSMSSFTSFLEGKEDLRHSPYFNTYKTYWVIGRHILVTASLVIRIARRILVANWKLLQRRVQTNPVPKIRKSSCEHNNYNNQGRIVWRFSFQIPTGT